MKSDFYINFENKFRGTFDQISSQLSKYDPLVDLVTNNIVSPRIVDIGSGRGEWLMRMSSRFHDCVGIECDNEMVNSSREKGLNILSGDAIDILSRFSNNSISVITIFHVIEHIDRLKLIDLMKECSRVLSTDGIILIETPCIDNLIVSTNNFYLDPTHISHINSHYIKYMMKYIGFDQVMDFYINGGPMMNDKRSKITRILNGVAQDLLLVATKDEMISKLIFSDEKGWQSCLSQAPLTLEAAVDFDLKNEQIFMDLNNYNTYSQKQIKYIKNQIKSLIQTSSEINNLRSELNSLKNDLKHLIKILKIVRKISLPFYQFIKEIKLKLIYLIKRALTKLIKYRILKRLLFSQYGSIFVTLILKSLPKSISKKYLLKFENKINKLKKIDNKSLKFNRYLLSNFDLSSDAKSISASLLNIESR